MLSARAECLHPVSHGIAPFHEKEKYAGNENHSPHYLRKMVIMVTMVTMGGDLQPGCLADRLLTGLGQPQINHKLEKKVYCSAEKGNHEQVGC